MHAADVGVLAGRMGFKEIAHRANRGQWFATAAGIFENAAFHLVEPQDVCWPDLERAGAARGRTTVHRTALTAPGAAAVLMTLGGDPGNTGAFVFTAAAGHAVDLESPATTLDALFASTVTCDDRVPLKLDIEVGCYDIHRSGRPEFAEVVAFPGARDFVLYDIDRLSSRPRDLRLRIGDVIFVRRGSPLVEDVAAE